MNYPRLLLAAVSALIVFFAWGFLTEGWLLRKDFAASAALYRTSDLQMKYMPLGLIRIGGAVSGRRGVRRLARRYIRYCEGIAVWPAYGNIRRMHPPYFQSDHAIAATIAPSDRLLFLK